MYDPWKTNKANFLNKSMCIQNLPNKKRQIIEDILISSLVKVKFTNADGIKEERPKEKKHYSRALTSFDAVCSP